jgi:hypothetical protein
MTEGAVEMPVGTPSRQAVKCTLAADAEATLMSVRMMMTRKLQQGERTPPAVRSEICHLAALKDRPTNQEIQNAVATKFGVTVSLRTISRICAEARLPTSSKASRSGSGVTRFSDSNMELSGHWPNLRLEAQKISLQLRVPLPQLLEFPWLYPQNPGLRFTSGKRGLAIILAMEEEALFLSLRKHLSRDPAWRLLREWQRTAGGVAGGLQKLCRWVEEQPEVENRQWLDDLAIERGETGLTRHFIRSLVLLVAEAACSWRESTTAWEVLGPNTQRESWVLNWVYQLSSFVAVAAASERDSLEEVQALHQQLAARMRSLELVAAAGTQWLKLEEIARELNQELERIANLALFPGQCDLCSGR